MNLRLVGVRPLVGVDLHQTFTIADSRPAAPCETCDGCGKLILARNIYFDGERFLCVACKQKPNLENALGR
jgi:hypothetical protein